MNASLQTCKDAMPSFRSGSGRSWIWPFRVFRTRKLPHDLELVPAPLSIIASRPWNECMQVGLRNCVHGRAIERYTPTPNGDE